LPNRGVQDAVPIDPLGIKAPFIPTVVGPFSYSTAQVSATQSILSVEAIQRFRAARTAEQAAALSYQDTVDVITLTVANSYLEVLEAASRIEAAEAQVRNEKAIYDQAVEDLHAGTSPKIDATVWTRVPAGPRLSYSRTSFGICAEDRTAIRKATGFARNVNSSGR
jgi:outer membrane protein TolC